MEKAAATLFTLAIALVVTVLLVILFEWGRPVVVVDGSSSSSSCSSLRIYKLPNHTVFQCNGKIVPSTVPATITYKGEELADLLSVFQDCFENTISVCSAKIKKATLYSEDCQYYINIKRLLTLCYGVNRNLTKGFINTTIFSSQELKEFYQLLLTSSNEQS